MSSTLLVSVPHCPQCGGSHEFRIEGRASMTIRMITNATPREGPKTVMWVFTCPVKSAEFKYRVDLPADFEPM